MKADETKDEYDIRKQVSKAMRQDLWLAFGIVFCRLHMYADVRPTAWQEDVLSETEMMIPDTRSRIEAGMADLQQLLEDEDSVALGEIEEVTAAKAILEEAKGVLGGAEPEPE